MASAYEQWHWYFLANRDGESNLPWQEPYRLSAAEVQAVAPSLQQFQLGEFARGRGLRRRAASHPRLDHRSLNIDTFNPIYVLMGHALPKEARRHQFD
jgi:hypothetical protein